MCALVIVHVTCMISVSSVTIVSRRGGGGGDVRTTPVSLTTGSGVASETAIQKHSIYGKIQIYQVKKFVVHQNFV